jgi:hypothetical protein
MVDPFVPDVPGRGAWTLQGGLLRLRPGFRSRSGYYRLAVSGETPVGSAYVRRVKPDRSDSARAVHCGVKALQALCGLPVAAQDGWLGQQSHAAVLAAQKRLGLTQDGIAGPSTLRGLLKPLIEDAAAKSKPSGVTLATWVKTVGGVPAWESGLDPAAVGVSGYDHGLAQINLGAHKSVTPEQAHDPWFALNFTVTDLREVYDRWVGKTEADPIDIACASHNSPAAAQQWARDGKPPYSQHRADNGFPQIDEYVRSVRAAW